MYNDEQNLYHYTYRKDGSESRSSTSVDGQLRDFQSREDRGEIKEMKPVKKDRLGLKIAALALCCSLLGGAAGGGAVWAVTRNAAAAPAESGAPALEEKLPEPAAAAGETAEPVTVQETGTAALSDTDLYTANVDSVVSINVTGTAGYNFFGQRVQTASSGSGFILTQDGYIATNYHVVEDADTVKVTLYNGDEYEAKYVGGDEDFDIAVVKVEAAGLKAVTLGDSTKVNVGDHVLAIGNPLGELTFSMTGGMVSCVNRTINLDGTPFNMIQTDVAINPGNSGGPMFNQYGEVIGIVSAKYLRTSSGSNTEGLGFAIPINDVAAMIKDIMTNGYVSSRPFLGITPQSMTKEMARQYRYEVTTGVFVCSTVDGSAAEKAGLRMGDVITKVDDTEIKNIDDLNVAKKKYSAGDTATLTIYRQGETITVDVTWDAAPREEKQNSSNNNDNSDGGYDGGFSGGYDDLFDYFFGGRFG